MRHLAWLSIVVFVGCASRAPTAAPTLTAAEARASQVGDDEARAQTMLDRGDAMRAVALADQAIRLSPRDPWAHYQRATALATLGQVNEAVVEYRRAEQLSGPSRRRGTELAMYGRARVLDLAGRCADAGEAYDAYAKFIRPTSAADAERALRYAAACRDRSATAPELTDIDAALMRADYADALALVEARDATKFPAWLDEARGSALLGLGRNEEAATAFERSAAAFVAAHDDAAAARAMFGKARALRATGACKDAARAYARFADFVRARSRDDADIATRYARDCPSP